MNTVLRQRDGSLIGTNTDAAGFYAPLADFDLEGAPVALYGSGGAARAVLFALKQMRVGPVTTRSFRAANTLNAPFCARRARKSIPAAKVTATAPASRNRPRYARPACIRTQPTRCYSQVRLTLTTSIQIPIVRYHKNDPIFMETAFLLTHRSGICTA
jgi:shikimate 5-dehydrogenase